MRKTTIYDIAKKCSVSPATVSRVLCNSNYPVSDELRLLVTETAHELNYSPGRASVLMRTKRSKDIGIILPTISNAYYSQLLQGICSSAAEAEYNVILCSSDRNPDNEYESLKFLLKKQVSGIIVVSICGNSKFLTDISRNTNLVILEQDADVNCSKVVFDYEAGMYMATEHLIKNGHRKIGFIGANPDRPSRIQMLSGYKKCLADNKIDIVPQYIKISDIDAEIPESFELKNGKSAASKFLKMKNPPTGFVCINDMTALGLINRLTDKGYSVPGDFSIIGFDNTPYAALSQPPLTTVEQSAHPMGAEAMKILAENIETQTQRSVLFKPSLIKRKTVSAPKTK